MASAGQDGDARDYGREAMVYFRDKMRAYGEGIEVPIKLLFLLDERRRHYCILRTQKQRKLLKKLLKKSLVIASPNESK